MDTDEFLEYFQPMADRVVVARESNDELRDNEIEQGETIALHFHWPVAARRAAVELLNERAQMDMLRRLSDDEFGSREWFARFYYLFYDEIFPIGLRTPSENFDGTEFFLHFREVRSSDYDQYNQRHRRRGYPVFATASNAFLRQAAEDGDREKWLKAARGYNGVYFDKATDIFRVAHRVKQDKPLYRLSRSLGIDADQSVFLSVDDSTGAEMVVKWEDDTAEALGNWRLVRDAGVDMLDFSTNHMLSPLQPVLVSERLFPITAEDKLAPLCVDVMQQLQQLHTAVDGPYVHADIKIDNILRRGSLERPKYFVIDWDSISIFEYPGVDNAVRRTAYSPLWTSQPPSYAATSYRYDLQELFYALCELARMQWTAEIGRARRTIPVFAADSRTLQKQGFANSEIIAEIHSDSIPRYRYLDGLLNRILDLPERLPPTSIDYNDIIEFVRTADPNPPRDRRRRRMTRRDVGESSSVHEQHACLHCGFETKHVIEIKTDNGRAALVCSDRCAALTAPGNYLEEAIKVKSARKTVRKANLPRCISCNKVAKNLCKCGYAYCSVNCQKLDFDEHQEICDSLAE